MNSIPTMTNSTTLVSSRSCAPPLRRGAVALMPTFIGVNPWTKPIVNSSSKW